MTPTNAPLNRRVLKDRRKAQDAIPAYDILSWSVMDPSLRGSHYLKGYDQTGAFANDTVSQLDTIDPVTGLGRTWDIKSHQNGFPWDINLYDDNYIYFSVTENVWTDPHTCKRFESPTYGLLGLRYPRFWAPGSDSLGLDSSYKIYTSCSASTQHSLNQVKFSLSGPLVMSMGGNLPPNLTTLIIGYFWNGSGNPLVYGVREQFYLQQPYGRVKWDTSNWDSTTKTYVVQKSVTFNQLVQATPVAGVNPCNF